MGPEPAYPPTCRRPWGFCLALASTLIARSLCPAQTIPTERDEGFGALTAGAASAPDGFTTYTVTSLDDDGPGTLRDALAAGRRKIVFDVAGDIHLSRGLWIRDSYLTVAGETAPSPGITIRRAPNAGFGISARPRYGPAHDIIIRHLRFVRDDDAPRADGDGDICGIDGSDEELYNVIYDHITAYHADDGVFDVRGHVHDVTVSWCLIADTLTATAIVGSNGPATASKLSFHHNVWARNTERLPRVRTNVQTLDLINNVMYQWDVAENGFGATAIVDAPGVPDCAANIINNHYLPGPGKPDRAIVYGQGPRPGPSDDGGPSQRVPQSTLWTNSRMGPLYVAGNIIPRENYDHWSTIPEPLPIPAAAAVTIDDADGLHERVIPRVGCKFRTDADQRLLDEVRTALLADLERRRSDQAAEPNPGSRSLCAPLTGAELLLTATALMLLCPLRKRVGGDTRAPRPPNRPSLP